MSKNARELRNLLDQLHADTGWDWAIRCEAGAHAAWSAEIRITPEPGRRDGPDRSYVIFATGASSPAAAIEDAYEDLGRWLAGLALTGNGKPCRYCTGQDREEP